MTLPSITGEPTTRAPVGNFHFKRWNSRGATPGYTPVCAALPRNMDCASAAVVRQRDRKRKAVVFIKLVSCCGGDSQKARAAPEKECPGFRPCAPAPQNSARFHANRP